MHAESGQRPLALRQFENCREVLKRELGVAPLPETVQLYREIAGSAGSRQMPEIASGEREATVSLLIQVRTALAQVESALAAALGRDQVCCSRRTIQNRPPLPIASTSARLSHAEPEPRRFFGERYSAVGGAPIRSAYSVESANWLGRSSAGSVSQSMTVTPLNLRTERWGEDCL
jgi:hypothetical protein